MMRLLFLLILLVGSTAGFAQIPPQAFNYSAVARDPQGIPIANQTIGIQISILQNSTVGPVVYSENHFANTDDFGLFNLIIGGGALQSGSMADIEWSTDAFYLKVGMDANGGTNFMTMGTTQFLSVPYALHAKTAESLIGGGSGFSGDYNDLINAPVLSSVATSGDYNDLSNLPETPVVPTNVSAFSNDAGYVTTDNDHQQMSVSASGDTLYLSNGNWVIIPGISAANADTPDINPWLNPELSYGTLIDQDGISYATIVIGTQQWMAENLRTTKYANGDPIPNVTDNSMWSDLNSGAWSHLYNESQYEIPYGKLYNGFTVIDPRNVCPAGWHVPTNNDWNTLINYLDPTADGGSVNPLNDINVAGAKMKSTGTEYWLPPNTGANNESGFSGLPGGERDLMGNWGSWPSNGTLWSATAYNADALYSRRLTYLYGSVLNDSYAIIMNKGLSIRCVHD